MLGGTNAEVWMKRRRGHSHCEEGKSDSVDSRGTAADSEATEG